MNISAVAIIKLLDKLREKYPEIPVSLVMNNARPQHCKAVKEHPLNRDIELRSLPAYSPDLNLIERVWKLTKKKCLTHKIAVRWRVHSWEFALQLAIFNTEEFFPCHRTPRNPMVRPRPQGAKIRRSSAAERVTVNH